MASVKAYREGDPAAPSFPDDFEVVKKAVLQVTDIKTPLGVLTLGQIEQGEAILGQLYKAFQKGNPSASEMERLSGEFYTCIPHRIGRTRAAVQEAIIDTMEEFSQKQETLQLMKDM